MPDPQPVISSSDPSENCVFCHIVKGKVSSRKVYEDDVVLAVLDIYPAAQGHVIVIPKRHAEILPKLSEKELAHLGITGKVLSHAVLKAFGCKGTSLFIANGAAAGQRAPHIILHIIPRSDGDGIFLNPPVVKLSDGEQVELFEFVKRGAPGVPAQQVPAMKRVQYSKDGVDLEELSRLMI